jgi:hypothetical protein
MAKQMMGQCGPKCIILGLLSAAFAAGGLWMIVGGIMKQWGGMMPWTNIFLWYFGGFVLFCIAKCTKMKACPMCRVM